MHAVKLLRGSTAAEAWTLFEQASEAHDEEEHGKRKCGNCTEMFALLQLWYWHRHRSAVLYPAAGGGVQSLCNMVCQTVAPPRLPSDVVEPLPSGLCDRHDPGVWAMVDGSSALFASGPTITLRDRSETENLRPVFSDLREFSDL